MDWAVVNSSSKETEKSLGSIKKPPVVVPKVVDLARSRQQQPKRQPVYFTVPSTSAKVRGGGGAIGGRGVGGLIK